MPRGNLEGMDRINNQNTSGGTPNGSLSSAASLPEASYRLLFDSLADPLHVVDRELTILTTNQALRTWNRHLGIPDDLVGKNLMEVFDFLPEHAEKEYARIFESGETLVTRETVFINGKEIYSETRKIPVFQDEMVVQVITIIRDITEEVLAAQQHARDQALLRSLMDAITEIILLLKPDGTIDALNRTASERLSKRNMAPGANIYDLFPTEIEKNRRKMLERVIENSQPLTFQDETNGNTVFHSLYPVLNPDGKVEQVAVFSQDITKIHQQRVELEKALQDKDILLRELRHRVKNNLSVLISLLEMQTHSLQNPAARQALEHFRSRVHAMAYVYDNLSQNEGPSQIEIDKYLDLLARNLLHAFDPGNQVTLRMEISNAVLDTGRALACGLIVNELVTNSLKHAFPEGSHRGERVIRVQYETDPHVCRLTVADNGVGFAETFDPRQSETLGLKLVEILARYQLGGSLEWSGEEGCTFVAAFSASTPAEGAA